ncbi:MAG: hypothetical protein ACI93T_002376 [Porticoccaceae bacterium]|jgi:hypothetical protein
MQITADDLLDAAARYELTINLPENARLGGDVSDETSSSGRSRRAA